MISVKPPHAIPEHGFLIFLAGTIEMGKSIDWQTHVEESLRETNAVILNPRRNFWDAGWKTSADDKNFAEQVSWELEGLEKSDLIIMNILPDSQSPISLLELGLFAQSGKMIVCCPDGYWKNGNVDMVCKRYGVPQFNSLDELIAEVQKRLYPSIEMSE